MGIWDVLVFIIFVIIVVAVGLLKSRNENSGEDYFLAGRGLSWWLIGFSLIAANISSEQFVGMSGNAASHVGLAIASYEWLSAITLVVVAFCFLPYFLKTGIYTMPQFLEYRYNHWARLAMAVSMLLIYTLLLGSVIYSGALTINTMAEQIGLKFIPTIAQVSFVIGIIAMLYVTAGGLKACVWADLIQGSALILGGGVVMYFAFKMLGSSPQASYIDDVTTGAVSVKQFTTDQPALQRFLEVNKVRLNMFLPGDDRVLPWPALLMGLWIPAFYYWGLNQYITQRTLGAASLAQGQKGIVFAAFLKLLIPFVIVIPGIIAFNLFADDMAKKAAYENAPVFTKYMLANPDSRLFRVADASTLMPDAPNGTFTIALYTDKAAIERSNVNNPFILPITKEAYNRIRVSDYTIFDSDDKSWKQVFPALALELHQYNQETTAAAKKAGSLLRTEKFVAYKYDSALAQLLSKAIPAKSGLLGFVLAALLGAIVSSLAAMLNAASTIFTVDIYLKYLNPNASEKAKVLLGRICVLVFSAIAILLAPALNNPKISHSIFTIIQESQGFISPGIVAVFTFGLLVRKAPRLCGIAGLLTSIICYGVLKFYIPGIQFLNRMAVCFVLCLALMGTMTILRPLNKPIRLETNTLIQLQSSKWAVIAGVIVVFITLLLYAVFSPIGIAK